MQIYYIYIYIYIYIQVLVGFNVRDIFSILPDVSQFILHIITKLKNTEVAAHAAPWTVCHKIVKILSRKIQNK